jgi:hypothetical protein
VEIVSSLENDRRSRTERRMNPVISEERTRAEKIRKAHRPLENFVTFVLFVVINFLTTKDTKHTKDKAQGRKRETPH